MGLEIIEVLKKERNLTSKELADLSGVPKGTLDKILSGVTKDPKLETLKALAKVLGCTLDDFDDTNNSLNNIDTREAKLIENYKKLNSIAKDKLVEYSNDLLQIPKYKKETDTKIVELPKKEKQIWEEKGKEYLMPIACHDDNLTDEEKDRMNDIINNYIKNNK